MMVPGKVQCPKCGVWYTPIEELPHRCRSRVRSRWFGENDTERHGIKERNAEWL
jgi:uncharacterized OB-fold protein